jgi:hypothetical protein
MHVLMRVRQARPKLSAMVLVALTTQLHALSFGPIGSGNVLLSGGGIPGTPDNGTGYLEIPDGNLKRLVYKHSDHAAKLNNIIEET